MQRRPDLGERGNKCGVWLVVDHHRGWIASATEPHLEERAETTLQVVPEAHERGKTVAISGRVVTMRHSTRPASRSAKNMQRICIELFAVCRRQSAAAQV